MATRNSPRNSTRKQQVDAGETDQKRPSTFASAQELAAIRARNEERREIAKWAIGLPRRYGGCQFANMTIDDDSATPIRMAKMYADILLKSHQPDWLERSPWEGPNLILHGPVGVGKTSLAWAVLFHIVEWLFREVMDEKILLRYFKANFFHVEQMAEVVRGTRRGLRVPSLLLPASKHNPFDYCDIETEGQCYEYLASLDLLIVDDIVSSRPLSPAAADVLARVVYDRHKHTRPMIITMNCTLTEAIDMNLLSSREVSRIADGGVQVPVGGPDRRVQERGCSRLFTTPKMDLSEEAEPEATDVAIKDEPRIDTECTGESEPCLPQRGSLSQDLEAAMLECAATNAELKKQEQEQQRLVESERNQERDRVLRRGLPFTGDLRSRG